MALLTIARGQADVGGRDAVETRVLLRRLGITPVSVLVHQGAAGAELDGRVAFIALHDNENVGVAVAREIVARRGGRLVELRQAGRRYLHFQLRPRGRWYCVDPNRMFTAVGRRVDEGDERLARWPEAVAAVRAFADGLLAELVLRPEGSAIVAVHNNRGLTLDDVAIAPSLAAMRPRPSRSTEFILVTEPWLFAALAPTGHAVGLVDRARLERAKDRATPTRGLLLNDGSLSVRCSLSGIPYANVEAFERDDRRDAQRVLIEATVDAIMAGEGAPTGPSPSPADDKTDGQRLRHETEHVF